MEEFSQLTIEQVGSFYEQVKAVFEMLNGSEKEQGPKKEIEKKDLVTLVKALKHRLPKELS